MIPDYRVTQLTVSVSRKDWKSSSRDEGRSSDLSLSWTVCPTPEQVSWSRDEAVAVQFKVGYELHKSLLSNAILNGHRVAEDELGKAVHDYRETVLQYEEPCEGPVSDSPQDSVNA